ncbi:MAG: methyltransferase [Myxococcota bacterium]|nr:methyltransferase [Myxococcota bacterium]
MRNPIRLKNLSLRLAPLYVSGALLWWLASPTRVSFFLGLVLVALGLAVRGWGVGYLLKTERLAISGPYAYVRNPLYLGTLLVGCGFSVMLGGWVGLVALLALGSWFGFSYFPRKEQIESERLRARYGEVYQIYYEQVPALWPRFSSWRPDTQILEQLADDRSWRFERYDANNELGTFLSCAAGVMLVAVRFFLT